MSRVSSKLLAAAGATGGSATYVDDVFSTYLYKGNNGTQTINNGIDLSGEGGLVWQKGRSFSGSTNWSIPHMLFDTERGTRKLLSSSSSAAESTPVYGVSSFNSNGFGLTDSYTHSNSSVIDGGYVSWTFRKQEKFFDIVTYTGNGTAGRTISHNLGSVPGMMIVKRTSATENWNCYHRAIDSSSPENYFIDLDRSAARDTLTGAWNNTAPTSTVFTVGNHDRVNASGHTYVAYLFAHDEQDFGEDSDEAIIKCGSYTGNGNDTGPVINLGFEPQWIIIKDTTSSYDWHMFDTMRNWNVVNASELKANSDAAEAASIGAYRYLKPLSTGFQITDAYSHMNTNNNNYIYMAIRRPHKPATEFAATKLFNVDAGANTTPGFDTGFPVDMGIFRSPTSTTDFDIMSRLTGLKRLDFTNGTEANKGAMAQMDHMDGWSTGANSFRGWAWRRAPGYFDAVSYTGTGTGNHQVTHNLGVVPEMMWIKCRSASANWQVYHSTLGATKYSPSFRTDPFYTSSARWQDTAPTSSVFTVGSDSDVNGSGQTFMAYLFASVDGISKVGSYSGSGSAINVDCGFSSGARFVLIKRSDTEIQGGTGSNWYIWDSVGGIVAGNDPYLIFNSSAVAVTNTDYIDPYSSGFTVTANAPNGLNASGGTYVFYAIA